MFRLHFDHGVEQSRVIANVLSFDRDTGFESTSFRISDRLGDCLPHCRFAWRQCTKGGDLPQNSSICYATSVGLAYPEGGEGSFSADLLRVSTR